jgi:hypothetical protein
MLYGAASAVIIFFLSTSALQHQAFRRSGEVMGIASLGATTYTCVVWAVNAQMAITVSYSTLIQHVCIWGGITLWHAFLVAYGAITPTLSTSYFIMVLVEAQHPTGCSGHPAGVRRRAHPLLYLRRDQDVVLPGLPQQDSMAAAPSSN